MPQVEDLFSHGCRAKLKLPMGATVDVIDSRAIVRVDGALYKGDIMWTLLGPLCRIYMSYQLTRNIGHCSCVLSDDRAALISLIP